MKRHRLPSDTRAAIHAIHATTNPTDRARLIEDFHRARFALYGKIARNICRLLGIPFRCHDDVVSEVSSVALVMLDEDPDLLTNWEGMLSIRAQRHMRTEINSGRWTGLSGASTVNRRVVALHRVHAELAQQLQREPTNEEIVAAYNDNVGRSYQNPRRHGVIATPDDLTARTGHTKSLEDLPHEVIAAQQPLTDPVVSDGGTDRILLDIESEAFRARVVAEAYKTSDNLGAMAHVCFGPWPHDDPTMKPAEVARQLNLPYEMCRRGLIAIRELARGLATPDDIPQLWQEAGFDPDEARLWARHGFTVPDAREWRDHNFPPARAATWRDAGFGPDDARTWSPVWPTSAAEWRDDPPDGMTSLEARDWAVAGFSPQEALAWRKRSFTAEAASPWLHAGHDPTTAARERDAGNQPEAAN